MNTADAEPAVTLTDAATTSTAVALLERATVRVVAVTADNVTVQVLRAFAVNAVGLQVREESVAGRDNARLNVFELPFRLAVITAVPALVKLWAVVVNVVEVLPAAMVTEAGTARAALLLESETIAPLADAARVKVTVQGLDCPEPKLVGLHVNPERSTGASSVKATERELDPSAAVTVADWVVLMVPALTVKLAVVAPAATLTAAGVVSSALLSERVTLVPLADAARVKVTVQGLDCPEPKLVVLHVNPERSTGASSVKATERELDPSAAVTVADWVVLMVPALTVKLAVVAPAATLTAAGVVSSALLSERVTLVPPAGAARVKVTVQGLDCPEPKLVVLHVNPERSAGACKLKATESELLPKVAVTVADSRLLMIPATTVNVAVVAPALTTTEDGVVRNGLLSASATVALLAGAAWFNVTEHVLINPVSRVVGLQASLESSTGICSLRAVESERLPRVAVSVAACVVVTAEAETLNVVERLPAGMVTEAGVVSTALLSDTLTTVPAVGAVWLKVTVQVDVAGGVKTRGLHLKMLRVARDGAATAIVPPVPVIGILVPVEETATIFVTAIVLALAVADRVTFTTAATPFWITWEFSPVSRQVYEPVRLMQDVDLTAAVAAEPGLTVIEAIAAAG